eukprot:jgi/Phyca11/115201/e_gw1.28.153.1
MDGVSGITQCQIQPNVTAIYRFKPDKCGTFWFHGHEEVQYAYGLRGPLRIWEKDIYKEYTLLLADWYHDLPVGAPIWDTVLINNVGRYNCTVAEAAGFECGPGRPLPRFTFVPGKKYLLRLINTSAMAAFKVSIDGHTFQVVASDADYLKPSTPVNSVTINVAQRYDIIVQANQKNQKNQKNTALGSYWLRVHSLFGVPWTAREADQVPEGFNPDALAIIDYQSGATADPTTSAWATEVAIGDPPLFTIAKGANTEDLPITANAIKLKHNDHVEVVVVNETPDQHPFHLHAHSPWIVGSGHASRDNILAGNLTALRLNGPMQHDVFTVPECLTDADGACTDLGYVVFRMKADNPGVWIMHCHIDWHFVLGLGMLFVEAEDALHEEGLAAFSPNMLLSVCNGNFTL